MVSILSLNNLLIKSAKSQGRYDYQDSYYIVGFYSDGFIQL